MSKSQGGASVSPYTSLPSPLKVGIITESEKYTDNERKMEGRNWENGRMKIIKGRTKEKQAVGKKEEKEERMINAKKCNHTLL